MSNDGYAIVLHHGLFGFDTIQLGKLRVSYFGEIERALIDRGHPVIVTRVHPTGGIERRARELKSSILDQLRSRRIRGKIIIIAHSMGGLDSRYMIAKLGMAKRVAALATICTPHRGSPYADWAVKNVGQRLGGLQLAKILRLDVQALSDLTIDNCRQFNKDIRNADSVKYFSISGARPLHRVPAFAMHAHKTIAAAEGPNDSLVSVKSSKWGKHLGIWPADHFHCINHRFVLELKDKTGDISPYYVKLVEQLEEELRPQMNADKRG